MKIILWAYIKVGPPGISQDFSPSFSPFWSGQKTNNKHFYGVDTTPWKKSRKIIKDTYLKFKKSNNLMRLALLVGPEVELVTS